MQDKSTGKDAPRRFEIRPYPLEYSRSSILNWSRPLQPAEEMVALEQLKAEQNRNKDSSEESDGDGKKLLIIDINDFDIYRSPGAAKNEFMLTPLQHFGLNAKELCINGRVSLGEVNYWLEDVRIHDYSIEGYGDETSPDATIYIQSQITAKDQHYDVWYKLGKSSKGFEPYHQPFKWLVNFAKHTIDYLEANLEANSNVGLLNFKTDFHDWLLRRFPDCPRFDAWQEEYGKSDYRVAVHAYIDFLYRHASCMNSPLILKPPLWAECLQGEGDAKELPTPTITTPLVHGCFKGMYFGQYLKETIPCDAVTKEQERRKAQLHFAKDTSKPGQKLVTPPDITEEDRMFKVGDIIGIKRDEVGTWKTTDPEWLAYVQKTEALQDGVHRLFIIWLYKPADTTISTMTYPIPNEVFMSDHCNCSSNHLFSTDTDIVWKYEVEYHPKDINTKKDIFIRQKYTTEDSAFVTLKASDFLCGCLSKSPTRIKDFNPGDAIYRQTTRKGRKVLEPVVFTCWDGDNKIRVRQLERMQNIDKSVQYDGTNSKLRNEVASNELVWTDNFLTISSSHIDQDRKPHIRFFPLDAILADQLPLPYNRRGNGDYWFITSEITTSKDGRAYLQELLGASKQLQQAQLDLSLPMPGGPLNGLSIFSGGGNLDRGLEEGGAVQFTTAIDFCKHACFTQRANALNKNLKVYRGSVDTYLLALLEGKRADTARIGDVSFIAGGSPCQGFSVAQSDWKKEQSLRNASHVTTICSFVDLLRPEYALLENVIAMANKRKGSEEEQVFSQVIACLVAMGYQVKQFIVDAWSHSSSQRRERLFVAITAPGLEPLSRPPQTHSHPERILSRSLGRLSNGNLFSSREMDKPTPLNYTTAEESVKDLPNIGSGLPQACTRYPDHRIHRLPSEKERAIMKRIPRSPPRSGYAEALRLGLIPRTLELARDTPGKSFRRVPPAGLFSTVMTNASAQDNRGGNILHWEQPRMLSIQEARRAQGIPDHEVIIGNPTRQWKIIGNAVDRNVSFALGLSLRRAVEANANDRKPTSAKIDGVRNENHGGSKNKSDPSAQQLQNGLNRRDEGSRGVDPDADELAFVGRNGHESQCPIPLPVKKKTRHSSLKADSGPERWDKVPEKALKRTDANQL